MIRKSIFFVALLLMGLTQLQAQITGSWKGVINIPGASLNLVFHIEDNNGQLSATLDVPDQGAIGLPVDVVKLEGSQLTLSIGAAGISYTGTLNKDEIKGSFKQSG